MIRCDADGVPSMVQSWIGKYERGYTIVISDEAHLPTPDYVQITLFTGDVCNVSVQAIKKYMGAGFPLHRQGYLDLAVDQIAHDKFKDMVAASRKYKVALEEYELGWKKGTHVMGTFRPSLPTLYNLGTRT